MGYYISNNGGYATPQAQNPAVANYRPRRNPSAGIPQQSADFRLGGGRFGGVSAADPPNSRQLYRPVEVARRAPQFRHARHSETLAKYSANRNELALAAIQAILARPAYKLIAGRPKSVDRSGGGLGGG